MIASPGGEWAVVLGQIREWKDAAALMRLFEYKKDELFAGDDSIETLLAPLIASERALAEYLAVHLNRIDGDGGWSYGQFYGPMRGLDATAEQTADLVDRCRRAEVALHHRPRGT